jgi:hypothetical protein
MNYIQILRPRWQMLNLVNAHGDGLGFLRRRTLAKQQTGQPNKAADEKYDHRFLPSMYYPDLRLQGVVSPSICLLSVDPPSPYIVD